MNAPLVLARLALCALWFAGDVLSAAGPPQDMPRVLPGSRIQYIFGQDKAVLLCAPLQICIIELQPGEIILSNGLHTGDTVRWHTDLALGANQQTHLIVKTIEAGITTDMTILTDRRRYVIHLLAVANNYMSAIYWHYPQTEAEALAAYQAQLADKERKTIPNTKQDVDRLNFGYRVSGLCPFTPVRVYDNERRVYIQLPAHVFKQPPVPTLQIQSGFVETLVLYQIIGHWYVVNQLFNQAVLFRGPAGRRGCKVRIRKI